QSNKDDKMEEEPEQSNKYDKMEEEQEQSNKDDTMEEQEQSNKDDKMEEQEQSNKDDKMEEQEQSNKDDKMEEEPEQSNKDDKMEEESEQKIHIVPRFVEIFYNGCNLILMFESSSLKCSLLENLIRSVVVFATFKFALSKHSSKIISSTHIISVENVEKISG
ncbi:1350_t:CDS:2, partial [Entrophospora sp. SA101]